MFTIHAATRTNNWIEVEKATPSFVVLSGDALQIFKNIIEDNQNYITLLATWKPFMAKTFIKSLQGEIDRVYSEI